MDLASKPRGVTLHDYVFSSAKTFYAGLLNVNAELDAKASLANGGTGDALRLRDLRLREEGGWGLALLLWGQFFLARPRSAAQAYAR